MPKFTVMIPVEIVASNQDDLRDVWDAVKDAGGAMWSTGGYEYAIRSDKLRLKDLREAFRRAQGKSEKP